MNSLSKLRMIFLYLCFTSLYFNFVYSGLADTNKVATLNGLVAIKDLRVGDKVLTYNFNATIPEESINEVAITKIEKNFADSLYGFYLEGNRYLNASPQQMVFTGKQEFDENGNPHIVIELVQAQYLTTEHMLVDWNMNLIPITDICKMILYEEKRVHKNYLGGLITKGKTIVTKFERFDMYSLELETPHIFLVPAIKMDYNLKDDPDMPLILMHNGLPVLGIGLSFAFGSTPASVAFAEATMTAGGLTATLGPAGLALGLTAGAGYFLYNLFSNNKNRLLLEKSSQNGGSSSNGPRDPKKKNNKEYPEDKQTDNTKRKDATFKNERDARNLARKKVGKDPVDIGDNKLRSQDGKWQYRAKPNDITGKHADGKHVHLEHLNPETGEVIENWHLYW